MNRLYPFYKNILIVFLFSPLLITSSFGQDEKPGLEFEVQINPTDEKLEVMWSSCLENSIITLMDNSLRPLKVQSLCKDNGNIDISDLGSDLYYVKVEHYTGTGMQHIVKDYQPNEEKESHVDFNTAKSELNFVAFPNPAQNTVTVEFDECLENSEVSLIDIHGRVLGYQILSKEATGIDISQLAKGIYFIKVEHATGVGVQRIVKE